MKIKFNQKLDEKMSKQKFSNCDLSYTQLEKITLRIEEITKPNNCIKKSNADFRMLRRFDLKYHSFNGTLIKKLVKKNTELMFVGTEDLFDVIHSTHIETGHGGRDILKKKVNDKYAK